MEHSSYRIRRLMPADRPLLRDLLGRCSEQARQQRYGSPTRLDGARAEAEIARLLAYGDRDMVLVAVDNADAPGELVGKDGLYSFSIADPTNPVLETSWPFPTEFGKTIGGRVKIVNGLAYTTAYRTWPDTTNGHGGLAIFRMEAASQHTALRLSGHTGR